MARCIRENSRGKIFLCWQFDQLEQFVIRSVDEKVCESQRSLITLLFTAAHCFQQKGISTTLEPQFLKVLIGRYNLSDHEEKGSKPAFAREIILHPDWDFRHHKYDADIAIVILTEPNEFSDQVQPICLPASTNQDVVGRGVVVGWGKSTIGNEHEDIPNQLVMPAINASYCYTRFSKLGDYSSHRAFCADFENQARGSCTGDSGGGFMMKDSSNDFWAIRGIVSASLYNEQFSCDVNIFGIYTNVAFFRDWIDREAQRAANGSEKIVEILCTQETKWFDGSYNCTHFFGNKSTHDIKVHLKFPVDVNPDNVSAIEMNNLQFNRLPLGIGESVSSLDSFRSYNGDINLIDRTTFKQMKNLSTLGLVGHKLKHLPEDVFWDLKNLTQLYLYENLIESLPQHIFSESLKLKRVSLNLNDLTHLAEDLFAKNLQLEWIMLNNNKLKRIKVDFMRLPKLKELGMEENICVDEKIDGSRGDHAASAVRELQIIVKICCFTNNKTESKDPGFEGC